MGLFNFRKDKKKPVVMYAHADYNQIMNNGKVDNIPVEKIEIGHVSLPTGQIVVSDPLAYPEMPALTRTVPPGNYPVTLYVAKTADSGDRIAIAVLTLQKGIATKFEMAVRPDEDISTLAAEDFDFFGFPVDAGLGGFMDHQTMEYYLEFLQQFDAQNPNGNIYDDFFAAEFAKNGTPGRPDGDWVHFTFPNRPELNFTMFSSGYGDGHYPAYWGMDEKNELINLVIDFHVLLLPDEKE